MDAARLNVGVRFRAASVSDRVAGILPANEVNGANASANVQPYSGLGVTIFVVHIAIITLLQAVSVNSAYSPLGVRHDTDA